MLIIYGTEYNTVADYTTSNGRLLTPPGTSSNSCSGSTAIGRSPSRHPNALPLIMTRGWPGSIMELLRVIGCSPIPW